MDIKIREIDDMDQWYNELVIEYQYYLQNFQDFLQQGDCLDLETIRKPINIIEFQFQDTPFIAKLFQGATLPTKSGIFDLILSLEDKQGNRIYIPFNLDPTADHDLQGNKYELSLLAHACTTIVLNNAPHWHVLREMCMAWMSKEYTSDKTAQNFFSIID